MVAISGVDVGGSGVRAVVRAAGEDRRGAVDSAVHRGSSIDPDALAATIVEVLRPLGAGADARIDVICIGMTGFPDLLNDPEPLARTVISGSAARAVIVASDVLTTHIGALSMNPGVVLAAGTGVIALGTDHYSRFNRVDGWGHLLGDEGSGAWIGRAGLVAGLRAYDGRRSGSPALLTALQEQHSDLDSLLHSVYEGTPAFQLARFTPMVATAARAGDAVAASIFQEAVSRLVDTAMAAAEGLDPVYSWGGGLFKIDDLLREPFVDAVLSRQPEARVQKPVGGSLDGALLMAERFAETGEVALSDYARFYER